ncbi:unnamed protein product [Hymenolepis diminuta]|uniref:Uncharacterized protein n=1 Tax=Hymenolepis diminuta TaxID=6216 RepID=A0A564YZB8_HYMDI|nr:unnamed protein product [Hymenolepis diminuta]
MVRMLKIVLENFWMGSHPRLDWKSPTEVQMGRRNRLKPHQSPECAPERRLGQ